MWTSASQQRQRLQLVRRSGLKALLKVSAHIRVSMREGGGFARLIRIRRKQVSVVTVMRQEDWRHFIVPRLTAAVFRPHRSEASTRDSLMTDHLPGQTGRWCLLHVPESNLKQARVRPATVAAPATVFKQQVVVR